MPGDAAGQLAADPTIMGGVPCLRGTRIPAVTVLATLAETVDVAVVLRDFPQLTKEDVRAVVHYAADTFDTADR